MTAPYRPVSCAVHTELEAAAVRGETVEVRVIGDADATTTWRGRVLDVYTQDGAEYLALSTPGGEQLTLRLDQVLALSREPRSG